MTAPLKPPEQFGPKYLQSHDAPIRSVFRACHDLFMAVSIILLCPYRLNLASFVTTWMEV